MRPPPAAPAAAPPRPGPDVVLPVLAAALVPVVHRRVLAAFFTPDDFVQLARAGGLEAWPASAWRWLSGFALAHATTAAFGADPRPYHALNLALLAAGTVLLFHLARRWGASPPAAFLAAGLFGTSRIHFTALAAASWAGEFLALALLLGALLAVGPTTRRTLAAAGLLVAALLAKESVLLVPLALLLLPGAGGPRGAADRRPAAWLVATGLLAGGALVLDGRVGGRLGGGAYDVAFGANLPAALSTLAAWSVDLRDAVPDRVTNADPAAWRVGLPALLALGAIALALRRRFPQAAAGAAWWLLGVVPVLPLLHQTCLHYLVTPFAGLALVAGAAFDAATPLPANAGGRDRGRAKWPLLVAIVAVAGWALAQDRLLAARATARLPGGETWLDPVTRKSELARRMIDDTRAAIGGGRARVAYFVLDGTQSDLDVRTGASTPPAGRSREPGVSLSASVLGGGLYLRAALPNVDSVLFVERLESPLRDFDCFLPYGEGRAQYLGRPPEALEQLAAGLLHYELAGPAARMLDAATGDWPGHRGLLWLHAVALERVGERERALAALATLAGTQPPDTFAILARAALASEPAPRR